MTFEEQAAATSGAWVDTHRPIVVAVDGSERNRSALLWAAHEAVAGGELLLVTVVEDRGLPAAKFPVRSQQQHAADMLADAQQEISHLVSDQVVRAEVTTGRPVHELLERTAGARMLVVGKRGLGGFARVIVGSTSIALAGRSPVPVTVVPDSWKQEDHVGAPVVIGIDPYRPHHEPIHVAFSRARRLGVPLVAVHGWEDPTVYAWDAPAVASASAEWEAEAHAAFDKVVDGWRAHFPDVEVRALHRHSHPAMAVLEAAENAQIVLLGRHVDRRHGGLAFGSVTRAVLHYSECPVTVVPSPERDAG
jgi:nucleotide-binding universal stress UspA family protein